MKTTVFGFFRFYVLMVFICADLQGGEGFSFPVQYSAEYGAEQTLPMVATNDNTSMKKQKIYVDGKKRRFEMSGLGMNIVSILRHDQHISYTLWPDKKVYTSSPLYSDLDKDPGFFPSSNTKFEFVGKESIKSIICDKYKYTFREKDCLIWIDASKKTPVCQTEPDGKMATIYWDNFKIGPQPADLFEVPEDYEKRGFPADGKKKSE